MLSTFCVFSVTGPRYALPRIAGLVGGLGRGYRGLLCL